MTTLEELRRRILRIDEEILGLWAERDAAARRAGELKLSSGQPLQNFEVEKSVLEHALATAEAKGVDPEATRSLVRLLIQSSVGAQERDRVRRAAKNGRTALLYGGAGLMGSWFARFFEEQGFRVLVEDLRPSAYPAPTSGDAAPDVILLAVPPSAVAATLEKAAQRAGGNTLILDIASTKGEAAGALRRLAGEGRKVASLHPMFGPKAQTLMGRNILVLDCGNSKAAEEAEQLFEHSAATTHRLPLEAHDAVIADILGLSHATSIAFNAALASGRPFAQLQPLASTTFRKQVEVSREVAQENPDLYFEIQSLNPQTPAALDRLRRAVERLERVLREKDRAGFRTLMTEARAYYGGDSS